MLINFIKKVCSSRPVTITQKVLKFPAFQFFTFTSKKFPALQFFTFTSPSHPQVNFYFFSLETKIMVQPLFLKIWCNRSWCCKIWCNHSSGLY